MENASNVVKIKAHGGDRAANLESIADTIQRHLEEAEKSQANGLSVIRISAKRAHEILGYMEQLRIIADELRNGKKVERGDFPPHDPIELD